VKVIVQPFCSCPAPRTDWAVFKKYPLLFVVDCLMSSHWVARVWCLVRWCVTCLWQASDRSLQTVTTSSSLWRDCVEHCPLFRMDWTDGVYICFRLWVSGWALTLYWHCAVRAIYMSQVLNFLRRSLRRWLVFCDLTSRSLEDTLASVIFDVLFLHLQSLITIWRTSEYASDATPCRAPSRSL